MCARRWLLRIAVEKRRQLARSPARLEFHAPVGQVSHPADDIEAFRDLFYGIAKANALHVAFVEDLRLQSCAASLRSDYARAELRRVDRDYSGGGEARPRAAADRARAALPAAARSSDRPIARRSFRGA